jgi:hypothetical protein
VLVWNLFEPFVVVVVVVVAAAAASFHERLSDKKATVTSCGYRC